MIHIDFSSKRVQLALRFFGYGVTALATIVLTAAAIFYAMGYRFSQADLSFKQGGLLQIQSLPDGALVTVDSLTQPFTTPGQVNISAGTHTVELSREGYVPWSKTITMHPGQLLRLDYPLLVPRTISTQPVRQFSSMAGALTSPDYKYIAVQEKAELPIVTFVDISDPKKPAFSTITIPDTQVAKSNGNYGQFSLVEWDASSRYVLLKQSRAGATDYIRLDRTKSPADAAVNISQQFRLAITQAHFATSNANAVYVLTDDVLRRLDIPAGSASAALVTGVRQFSMGGDNDTIAFVAERASNDATIHQMVGVYRGKQEHIVRTFAAGQQTLIAYSEYFGHSYLAIGSQASQDVQLLLDPSTASKDAAPFERFDIGQAPQWLQFSPNGRMLAAGAGNTAVTYDTEVAEEYRAPLAQALGADLTTPPRWLNNFYMWANAGDHAYIFEFDGQNEHKVVPAAPGLVALSQDSKTLFSFSPVFALQSSNLQK